jgi:superfamily II DNA or RNA helicase
MFKFEQGRLTTGYGFIAKITRLLEAAGHDVRFLDISPTKGRPDCYLPDWDNLAKYFTPRARQLECLTAISQTYGGLIHATMGFGKTHMFTAMCHLYPKARIAIVVKPKDVCARIVRQLTKQIPNVGQVGGGKKRMGDRVTVFTAGSAHHAINQDFDILLCDEVHQLMSDNLSSKLGEAFINTRNYAFSASPFSRMDGAHAKIEMFFGPTIFELFYPEAVELGLVVPIHVRWLKFNGTSNPASGKSGITALRWGIWRNDERHAFIAQDAREHYGPDHQVLIGVAVVDHAIRLWRHLPEYELCYSGIEDEDFDNYKKSGLIPYNFQPMTSERRDNMRTAFESGRLKKVIATDVWSTGVDFEPLQTLYRADARESEILSDQWPGRTSRILDGKDSSEVIDVIDNFDKNFKRKSESRKRHYKKHGWTQDWPSGRRQIGHV